ncbi:MAG TPA: response regulator [Bryobacteraceae bacterium]|nr:response regulator [Bryobacteraceae bacterium]
MAGSYSMTPCVHDDSDSRQTTLRHDAAIREPMILIVENDWRTSRFIRTILKYETNALVMEASCPRAALLMAKALDRPIDLLIVEVELAHAKSGLDLAREIAAITPSIKVLLMSFRDGPPCNTPPAWRFLSIPFRTETFLSCVSQLCDSKPSCPCISG